LRGLHASLDRQPDLSHCYVKQRFENMEF
jgi:hypothetical protein